MIGISNAVGWLALNLSGLYTPAMRIVRLVLLLAFGALVLPSFSLSFPPSGRPAYAATNTFSNTAAITLTDASGFAGELGIASPYPSTINVAGFVAPVTKVTVTLNSYSDGFPDDVDMLLVSPTGKKIKLMSDGGAT